MKINKMDLTKIRVLAIAIILFAFVPLIIDQSIYGYVMAFIILGIGFIVSRHYKCPHCKEIIDIRINMNSSYHCMKCGEKIK